MPLPPPSRPAIPKEIQEEIDQTPAWWDREFTKLLRSLPGYQEIEAAVGKEVAPYVTKVHPPKGPAGDSGADRGPAVNRLLVELDTMAQSVEESIKQSYSSRAWEMEKGRFSRGGYFPDPTPPTTAELETYTVDKETHWAVKTAFLKRYGLDPKRISDDGWNRYGYWYMTDEWEYEDTRTFMGGDLILQPRRVKEWREWPEGFDYERMVTLWRRWRGR